MRHASNGPNSQTRLNPAQANSLGAAAAHPPSDHSNKSALVRGPALFATCKLSLMSQIEVSGGGVLTFRGVTYTCALGRSGVTTDKHEGDGATPAGEFPLRQVLYRPDRLDKPRTALPVRSLREEDGWCDDPMDERYNQHVTLPYSAKSEELWREDCLYDIITVIGFNDLPPIPGRGSAIFLHVAAENLGPTQGCVALAIDDLLEVLHDCTSDTRINIRG